MNASLALSALALSLLAGCASFSPDGGFGAVETAGTSGDLDATRALAATGQTLNIWIPIVGGVLLLGGAAAIVINVLRRRRQP